MNTQMVTCTGTVIAKSKAIFTVSCAGRNYQCQLDDKLAKKRKNFLDWPVIGDRVQIAVEPSGTGQIDMLYPRLNLICRRAVNGKQGGVLSAQAIAANVDQLVGVMSITQPQLKWPLLDRYLVMAEAQQVEVVICLTKSDLAAQLSESEQAEINRRSQLYRGLGYRLLFCSVNHLTGMEEISRQFHGRTSLLIGKSGVGKTSLLNQLLPESARKISQVNQITGKGRHTTTALQWLQMDDISAVIDTPGTRELGLWDVATEDLPYCFPEMKALLGQCKFGLDCRHVEEPGCAIRQAVVQGEIDPYRYQSYRKLREEWR